MKCLALIGQLEPSKVHDTPLTKYIGLFMSDSLGAIDSSKHYYKNYITYSYTEDIYCLVNVFDKMLPSSVPQTNGSLKTVPKLLAIVVDERAEVGVCLRG